MRPSKTTCIINGLSLLAPMTGVSRFTYEICKRLVEPTFSSECDLSYRFLYHYPSRHLKKPHQEGHETDSSSGVFRLVRKNAFLKRFARTTVQTLARLIASADLYWEPNQILLPLRAHRTILTVHDLSCHIHPEWHPAERVSNFRRHFEHGLRRADIVVTDTETIKDEIISTFGVEKGRIITVPLGVDHHVFRPMNDSQLSLIRTSNKLPERFILFVGTMEPRKNLKRLLEAYAAAPEEIQRNAPLVIAGFSGWRNENLHATLRQARNVILLGHVSEIDLAGLYNLATMVVYPSLYEGFGLPPLEAMACGAPVITSDIPVLRETCGTAAVFVSPDNTNDLMNGMIRLLKDQDEQVFRSRQGKEHSLQFSWEKTTKKYESIFRNICIDI